MAMRSYMDDFEVDDDGQLLSGGPTRSGAQTTSEEEGGAYVTISQRGSERQHREKSATAETPNTDES